eukprot:scaffold2575_cov101-Isochrysis_galbana.AAC.2
MREGGQAGATPSGASGRLKRQRQGARQLPAGLRTCGGRCGSAGSRPPTTFYFRRACRGEMSLC